MVPRAAIAQIGNPGNSPSLFCGRNCLRPGGAALCRRWFCKRARCSRKARFPWEL